MKKRMIIIALVCAFLCVTAGPSSIWFTYAYADAPVFDSQIVEKPIDDSILLVNRDHPLPKGYKPVKLVDLYEQKRSFKLEDSDIYLEKHVFSAVNKMFLKAKEDGITGFILTSGFRTEKKQRQLYKADTQGIAAAPGESEHQTGLAFDVIAIRDSGGFETTKQFKWLIENCWDYGFILRYPEDAQDITGFSYEPWHYRFVGVEAAQAMHDSGQTLEEYLGAY